MKYDTSNLARLGRRRAKLLGQLDDVEQKLKPEVVAAKAARLPDKTIMSLGHVSRQSIRNWLLEAREQSTATDGAELDSDGV